MRKAVRLVSSTVGMVALLGVIAASALAAGDANVASCDVFGPIEASPGFRAYMPDCRGLELVTPPYNGGEPLTTSEEAEIPMSPDGRHVIGVAFAGFAGAGNLEESSEFGAVYEMSRGVDGWSTEALDPQASMATRSNFAAASADLSKTLWTLSDGIPGEEVNDVQSYTLYLREGGGTSVHWTPVGPAQPSPLVFGEHGGLEFVGASDDLGVLLLTPGPPEPKYWAGDPTPGRASLYQYRGVGNSEPELVGIANEGLLTGTPKNESAVLESDCGTTLGSSNVGTGAFEGGSAFNAISSSGSTIFFSALHTEGCELPQPAVTELYARVENGLSTAHTVAISEPAPVDCSMCDLSEPAEATFEGAAADGSRVFFLSEQKLLPGAAGQDLYEFDFNAAAGQRLKLVASDASGMARLSNDGKRVFFASTNVLSAAADSGLSPEHSEPVAGGNNLYVLDDETGEYAFVAPEAAFELWSRRDVRPIQTTEDGRYTVFRSASLLTPDDSASTAQLFEYDAATRTIRRISVGQRGEYPCPQHASVEAYDCNGTVNGLQGPTLEAPFNEKLRLPARATTRAAIGPAGEVAFTDPDALTPGAVSDRRLPTTNGEAYVENVYEYRERNVYLISPGDEEAPLQSTEPSRLLGMSSTGSDVFFFSTSQLVPQDTDTQADWYDARIGGGRLPEENRSCSEGTCQTAPSPRLGSVLSGGTELSAGETPPVSSGPAKVKTKPESRASKLRKAVALCSRKRSRSARRVCVKSAKRRFGKAQKSTESLRRGAHR